MAIILVDKPIARKYLIEMAQEQFGDMVKAVVDIEEEVMAIGGGLHSDEEAFLLDRGSNQEKLFDSVINIRPRQDNR